MSAHLPDFDRLEHMARHDPDGLERLRRRLVHELIERASPAQQRRLRGLQFQIDMERRRAPNPMAACVRLSTMMRDSLLNLQQALNEPRRQRPVTTPARVLRFAPPFIAHTIDQSTRR